MLYKYGISAYVVWNRERNAMNFDISYDKTPDVNR